MAMMDVGYGVAAPQLLAIFDHLLEETRAVGGLLVINFHTDYVADIDAPGVHAQFREILGRIQGGVSRGELACLPLGQAVDHISAP
jgi:hypothetical protein